MATNWATKLEATTNPKRQRQLLEALRRQADRQVVHKPRPKVTQWNAEAFVHKGVAVGYDPGADVLQELPVYTQNQTVDMDVLFKRGRSAFREAAEAEAKAKGFADYADAKRHGLTWVNGGLRPLAEVYGKLQASSVYGHFGGSPESKAAAEEAGRRFTASQVLVPRDEGYETHAEAVAEVLPPKPLTRELVAEATAKCLAARLDEGLQLYGYPPGALALAAEVGGQTEGKGKWSEAEAAAWAAGAAEALLPLVQETLTAARGRWTEDEAAAWLARFDNRPDQTQTLNAFEQAHGIPHAKLARWAKKRRDEATAKALGVEWQVGE